MIYFEFMDDTGKSGRTVYIGFSVWTTQEDAEHEDEIFEQLNAQEVGWA